MEYSLENIMGSNPYLGCGRHLEKYYKTLFKGGYIMKNRFLSFLQKESNVTYTENGATALKTTSSSLLDLFGTI